MERALPRSLSGSSKLDVAAPSNRTIKEPLVRRPLFLARHCIPCKLRDVQVPAAAFLRRLPLGGFLDSDRARRRPLLSRPLWQLRTEAGLSQADLAERVGSSDARQISRYENGRITPSLDATIRIAQALNISLDYLAIDNIPRLPLHVNDHGLAERLTALAELDDDDRTSLLRVLDAMLTRTRLKALASDTT